MRLRHLLLALVVVAIWGVNFAIIKLGLRQVSPLGLGVARFFLAAFPWVFFIRRPDVPLRLLAGYGLMIFALQFGLLFTGMKIGMSAGLASLILQLQVFFTIGLSVVLLGERPSVWQISGALLAFCGVGLVAAHVGGEVTLAGLALLIGAAAAWGGGNVVSKRISQTNASVNVLGLVVWGSLIALPPLLIVALVLERETFLDSFTGLDWVSAGSIAYIVYLSTLFGFAVWSRLLGLYPVSTVAPFTLLVPVFGFLGSAVLLGEPVQDWKLIASALVIAGLCLNLFGPRLFKRRAPAIDPPPSQG
ncbi:acetylserine transporter [Mesorhizobium sp. Root554]|uniref:EamA family transporter n=1 Tax=unclassified Mesorhizobium TaxID=325217 RepID=UPI0007004095|nr:MULTISPECIES: EamA family transporter [unclassified Mesorhizobium]KQZ14571.1 acetylserine transporter [Mesorhizobium sp. Root1471]KQZ37078.1 acetylserine transporter [Mesorhizobium sp. Root554]